MISVLGCIAVILWKVNRGRNEVQVVEQQQSLCERRPQCRTLKSLNGVPATAGILTGQVFRVFRHAFRAPVLTQHRTRCAYIVAVTTDALQLLLGPFGWAFADELLDLAATVLTWRLIGFHPLLLPTFVLEFVPLADMLPSWTVCVAIVVAIRKRQQSGVQPPLPPGPVIDI
jgi:hypothetical protein